MTVRISVTSTAIPDTVDEMVADTAWIARRDQAMATLQRTTLHVYGGSAHDELTADRQGVER